MLIKKLLTSVLSLVRRIKRSKVLSRNNRFQKSYDVKYFKEIKYLRVFKKGAGKTAPGQGQGLVYD